ncbi:shugoshin 1-like [Diretmus argenteus]
MVRERGQKKSYQQSLEDIKERMKEKRNKRLARASAPKRGRSNMATKTCGGNTKHILEGVQQNNKALAVALQAEKEKVRQANQVILQLNREQQALFLHLLLLKRKLKEQMAQANLQVPETFGQPEFDTHVTLPPTVNVRRRCAEKNNRRRSNRRRSELVEVQRSFSDRDPIVPLEAVVGDVLEDLEALTASPVHSDNVNQKCQEVEPEPADSIGAEELQHSTPEPVPAKSTNTQQPHRKPAQQQPRPKPEPAAQKPERGRKPERAPLKKPWENPKPRTRSKSRDRSATRVRTAPPPQVDKLGLNDTFDFDCEEAVHLAPFRSKADDSQPPNRTTRRVSFRRPPKRVIPKGNIPLQQEMPVFRDKELCPKALHPEKEELHLPQSPDCVFANSPEPMMEMEDENPLEPCREEVEEDCLLPVTPGVEAEMTRIDNVLSSFGESSTETPPPLPSKMRQRANTCKERARGVRRAGRGLSLCDVTNLSSTAFCKFSCGSPRPSDGRHGTPVPTRKRRATTAVDYKEPSLNAKLRRGDKFTDLQFLSSPVFKQKSGRRSVLNSRKSTKNQQPFKKYSQSFGSESSESWLAL